MASAKGKKARKEGKAAKVRNGVAPMSRYAAKHAKPVETKAAPLATLGELAGRPPN